MDKKPQMADEYDQKQTDFCERALVTLLGGLGSLKDSLRLIGGLVPRFLTPAGPNVPPHAGTRDVDVVLNLQVLAKGEDYAALGRQLKQMGFERGENDKGERCSWRWKCKVGDNEYVVVEFLRDRDDEPPEAKRVHPVADEEVSACIIDHCGIVHDWFLERKVTAELFGGKGVATEIVRYADLPSFVILKALALWERRENKDVGDLMHVLRFAGTLRQSAELFHARRAAGKHPELFDKVINVLRMRFCDGDGVQGFERDGPMAYANFLYRDEPEFEDDRMAARRYAASAISELLRHVDELGKS
jgi:hypothetical protein